MSAAWEPPRGRSNAARDAAIRIYEETGYPVLPCGDDKKPLRTDWTATRPRSFDDIDKLFAISGAQLVGVLTGEASGFFCVDVDPAGAPWLTENFARLECARIHSTRREGGRHLFYAIPAGWRIKNSAGKIAAGIDTRGEGGQVIWWPEFGGRAVEDDMPGAPPKWLLDELARCGIAERLDQPRGNGHAPAGMKEGAGRRNVTLTKLAGSMRGAGFSVAAISEALHKENHQRFDPPLPGAEVNAICSSAEKWEQGKVEANAGDRPINLLALDLDKIMQPIPPERNFLPGIPREAYTLIAGALSAYKSTLLQYLIIWRATGYDFLNLDADGAGFDIGPAVLIFYEDTDSRVLSKMHRILQSGYAQVERVHGQRCAREFLTRATQNIRRIPFTGCFRKTIVTRAAGIVLPNEPMIEELLAKVRAFTGSDVMIGIDPLRLAIVGSQNDDDGADVVVHTLNRLSVAIPDSGLVVVSHTTKAGAQDPAEGYTGKSYATSGSALYSQHARSNFHMARIKPDEIPKLFDTLDVPADQYGRQPVALLTHGRLSHGAESPQTYMRMKDGILLPLNTRQLRSAAEISDVHLPLIVSVIDDIKGKQRFASETALAADERLLHGVGNHHKIRAILKMLDADGYIVFTGKTRDRDCAVTAKGRSTNGTNWNESTKTGGR